MYACSAVRWNTRVTINTDTVSWLQSAPVVCFGSSSVFQFLFGYPGRCSCSFTSIDTLSAWHYDSQVCSRCWSRFNEYFDEFNCRTYLWNFAAELDFDPAGFTVIAAMHDQCTTRRRGCRGGQLHAKPNLKPGSYSQIPDVIVNRRSTITSWLYTHYILHYCWTAVCQFIVKVILYCIVLSPQKVKK